MRRDWMKHYSGWLERDMNVLVHGHGGVPVIAVPCQDGMCDNWESFQMQDTLGDFIEQGRIQLFGVDTVDRESWSDKDGDKGWRAWMQERYFHYLAGERTCLPGAGGDPFVHKGLLQGERAERRRERQRHQGQIAEGKSLAEPDVRDPCRCCREYQQLRQTRKKRRTIRKYTLPLSLSFFASYFTPYLKKSGSFSRKIMSSRSAASPSARTAALPVIFPPAASVSFSSALSDSPVLITSSTMRTRFPVSISA